MKRSFLLLIAFISLLTFNSCERDYTCYCYEAYSPADYPIKAGSEEDAREICEDYARPSWRDCELK